MPRKIRVEMEPPRRGPIAGRTRFLLLVLVVFCLTINWANILTFSFTVICMHQSDGAQHEEAAREKRSTNHDEMPKAADRRFSPNSSSGVDNNTSSTESDEMKKHNISQPTISEKDSAHAPGMANRTEKWLSIVKPNDGSKKELPQNDDSSSTSFLTRELTNYEKSQAMAVVAAGALVANLPIVILINWYGPRTLFTVVGLLGAFATAMVPTAMKAGWNWFLFVRVLQGVAFAGDMATFGHFVVSWSYYKQYAFFTSTLCVYVQLAPIFTNPISGMLCNSPLGWPGVYYVHSGVAIFLFITFYVCYRNHPHQHPMVGDLEREKIGRGRDVIDHTAQRHVPYMSILKSPAAWAVFVGAIGNFAGINLLYQFTPTYLYKVQGFAVVKTGFMAALPPLLMAAMKEVSGITNDRIKPHIMSETVKTRLYNSVAFFSMVFFLVVLTFIPPGHGFLALSLLTAGATFLGFNTGGFYKSGSLIAGPYAPFVLGQVSTAMTIMLLVVPLIVNFLTPNNTNAEWSHAFWAIAAIMVVCNLFYMAFGKGELEPWARPTHLRERIERRQNGKGQSNGSSYRSDTEITDCEKKTSIFTVSGSPSPCSNRGTDCERGSKPSDGGKASPKSKCCDDITLSPLKFCVLFMTGIVVIFGIYIAVVVLMFSAFYHV